ncbi:cbb3-type cytochrome oxidase assembly protein CcoS (plasmid) [Sinorhizobium mexicanum]|uniref:Cbb3-type cytochrome oxidase assembly protein CcoS n=1 Tax=Sinorhizobium mexicanum TaxID=375549 RepID=A0A859QEA8_9HYPH|nr:cbb3-type cytochrome oxidase assembly protein CcoS [Sinorhizobium mexicanum]
MNTLVYLMPIALVLGGLGLVAFLWALTSGQYEDLDGASWRVLDDRDGRPQTRENVQLLDRSQKTHPRNRGRLI